MRRLAECLLRTFSVGKSAIGRAKRSVAAPVGRRPKWGRTSMERRKRPPRKRRGTGCKPRLMTLGIVLNVVCARTDFDELKEMRCQYWRKTLINFALDYLTVVLRP